MFPSDVIFLDILVRLPVKSLLRFSCVSKLWRTTIADPCFNAVYHSRAAETDPEYLLQIHCNPPCTCSISRCNELLIEQEALELPVSSLSPHEMPVIGSCNGLLCLAAASYGGREIYLLNPAIKRLKLLPPSPDQPDCSWNLPPRYVWLSNSSQVGIGYDSSTADYKILKISHIVGLCGGSAVAQIYSLRSNSWKLLPNSIVSLASFTLSLFSCPTAVLNGSFYWLVEKEESEYHHSSQGRIKDLLLCFDFTEETFKEIRLPESLYEEDLDLYLYIYCIGDFKGKLYLMLLLRGSFEIWMLMEENSWVKTFCGKRFNAYITPLSLGMNNEVILLKRCKQNGYRMFLAYDLDTGTMADLGITKARNVFLYAPSLALLGEESQSFEEALSSEHYLLGYNQMVKVAKNLEEAEKMKNSG